MIPICAKLEAEDLCRAISFSRLPKVPICGEYFCAEVVVEIGLGREGWDIYMGESRWFLPHYI
jgi:hypothetical protein